MSDLLLMGIVAHLVADWLLQNDWMARNKASLRHPAAWVHGGIHFALMLLVFSPPVALVVATTHMLLDTRRPLAWWRRVFRQTREGDVALHVALWGDQVAHVVGVTLAAALEIAL